MMAMQSKFATKVPVPYALTAEEAQEAFNEGLRRHMENEASGMIGRNGGPSHGVAALRVHILGATGEMAVASYLDLKDFLFQDRYARRGSCDLPGIDVKTRSRHYYDLIVQRDESPEKKFVLVTIESQKILLHGWCYGREAMQKRFLADPARNRPAYFVPQKQLRNIAALANG